MRIQLRVKDGRFIKKGYLDPKIAKHVERESKRFDVSQSFVINVALAEIFDIELFGEDYRSLKK